MNTKPLYISVNLSEKSFIPFLIFLCTLFFSSFSHGLFAQQKVNSSQVLARKVVVEGNDLLDENLEFLKEEKQTMPVINDVEVRTETDELDLSRQEYLMRLNFSQRKARKIQNQITQNNIQFYELKGQIREEAELINRYELIIDWYYAQEELAHLETIKVILKDKKTVYRNELNSSLKLNLEDLLTIEAEIQELERKILKFNLKKEYIIQQLFIDQTTSTNFQLDSSQWVSLKTISEVLEEIKELPTYNLAQAIQETKINNEQLIFNQEKAENNQVLDFVQLKYAGRENQLLQQEFSLGIGLRLPFKSSGRVKLNEAQLEIFDEKYKQEIQQANLNEKITGYYAAFAVIIQEYKLLQNQISENQFAETLKDYRAKGSVNPIILLQLNEAIQKNQQALRELEKDACELYLEVLADKGLLSQVPLINYLSDDLKQF